MMLIIFKLTIPRPLLRSVSFGDLFIQFYKILSNCRLQPEEVRPDVEIKIDPKFAQ